MARLPDGAPAHTRSSILLFTMALAGSFAGLMPAPLMAGESGYFQAELAKPLAQPRQEILNGVIWHCAESSCTGTKGGSRAQVECQRLAQKVGPITAFTRGTETLDEAGLARCNR